MPQIRLLLYFTLVVSTANTVFGVCYAGRPPEPDDPPNIVLILADDLGYGDLGSYGNPTIKTPRLDQLASEGYRFTSYYSAAPSCTPARAALLTGRYPLRATLPNVLGPDTEHGIPASEVTLAEALKSVGYQTAAIGKWHLGSRKHEHLPLANGFDSYFGLLYSNDMIPPWVQTDRPLQLYRGNDPLGELGDQSELTTRYTEEALDFIRKAKRPFFLYLAHSMPHVPISVPTRFSNRSESGLYGDVIETIDWSTGRILDLLQELNLTGNTLVAFTSDNGPWLNMPPRMFSRGIVKPWHAGSPGPLRGAKATTYEGGMRVPALLKWPAKLSGGREISEPAVAMDLFATIAAAAGANLPKDRTYDGFDLAPALRDGTGFPRRDLFYMNGRGVEAIRSGQWKLRITTPGSEEGAETLVELFDLAIDPSERYNRAADFPDQVRDLTKKLRAFEVSITADSPVQPE